MAIFFNMPLLARLATTAALAVVIGGFLSGYQWVHAGEPRLAHVIPASREMMRLLRDEHDLVANMVKAQLATEQAQHGVGPGRARKAAVTAPYQRIAAR
jgi:flavin reductase (DIM6/NTAB) family NADH-FMN oxidoreductase RutF